MSTDRQDLSPLIQRDAIAKFASINAFSVVRSYEDQGRSGVHLTNRPALRQLLKDVVDGPPFTCVLVYDVSRWGRFQDADAAAYYEYHCRLHGVQVIYVAEPFGHEVAPMNALIKNMKRLMASEYSRDLATKSRAGQERVISMGFHMGPLPPFGYRRCSVSADGTRRMQLEHGQLKLALTDRIEWVLAPPAEVALVRRICDAYARSDLDLWQIAQLVATEGWVTVRGREVRETNLRSLVRNEALIGNFVWGVSEQNANRRIIQTAPTRVDGSVPRIVDDLTWDLMQRRLRKSSRENLSAIRLPKGRRRTLALARLMQVTPDEVTRRQHSLAARIVAQNRLRHSQEFGVALAGTLISEGITAAFDRRLHAVYVWDHRVRVKLMWPNGGDWWVPRIRDGTPGAALLLVKMQAEYHPAAFYLLPPHTPIAGHVRLNAVARDIATYRCSSPQVLLNKIAELRSAVHKVNQSKAPSAPRGAVPSRRHSGASSKSSEPAISR
jgi:DNA invertase Pin-like site-specific DNA recombinase